MYQPQDTTAYNPYAHYPNQYPATTTVPTTLPFFPVLHHPQAPYAKQTPPEVPPLDPPEPAVTPTIAANAIHKLVSFELNRVGFDSATELASQRLEIEVIAFIQQLMERAQEYGNLSNRARAIAPDVMLALEEFDIEPKELYQVKKATTKRKRGNLINLEKSTSRSPSPELLASDDEGENNVQAVPTTLRNLPPYFPSLPPKHTYLQTPPSPPKKAALPALDKKLKTAALVQESLQNLLTATEDSTNQEDGELLGHIVNWEINAHPRKRWKVGQK